MALVCLPLELLMFVVYRCLRLSAGFPDFRVFRLAGLDVLHGRSPFYAAQTIHSIGSSGFVYPAPAAWVMVPFGLMPFRASVVCFTVLTIAAVVGTLWLLDVRDLRCYTVALVLMPVTTAITVGTVSTLLACAAAVVWRFRDGRLTPALALAATLMLKPLLWPLVVWLAVTRRWRAAALTVLTAGIGTAAAYAALHINGLRNYPALAKAATFGEGRDSYSLYSLFNGLHAPHPLLTGYLVGSGLLGLVLVLARRDEQLAFVASLAASVALAPILWINSFSLLLIPLAFASRRLTWWWGVPVLMWLLNAPPFDATAGEVAAVWLLAAITLVSLAPQARSNPVTKLLTRSHVPA